MLMDRINMLSHRGPRDPRENRLNPFAFAFLSYIRVVRANLMQNFPQGETFPRHSEFQAISPWLFFPIFVNNYGVYGPRFLRFVFSLGKRRFNRVSPVTQRNSFRKLSRPTSV